MYYDIGHELVLEKSYGGNLSSDEISEEEFNE